MTANDGQADDATQMLALPVMEVDIDRIHDKYRADVFAVCVDGDGRMNITTGAATLRLPPHHTRRLMAWVLDWLVQRGDTQ